jgi:hypothetical protein
MKMAWAGYLARMGEKRVLMEKPEGKRPLRRFKHRWLDNITRREELIA